MLVPSADIICNSSVSNQPNQPFWAEWWHANHSLLGKCSHRFWAF